MLEDKLPESREKRRTTLKRKRSCNQTQTHFPQIVVEKAKRLVSCFCNLWKLSCSFQTLHLRQPRGVGFAHHHFGQTHVSELHQTTLIPRIRCWRMAIECCLLGGCVCLLWQNMAKTKENLWNLLVICDCLVCCCYCFLFSKHTKVIYRSTCCGSCHPSFAIASEHAGFQP